MGFIKNYSFFDEQRTEQPLFDLFCFPGFKVGCCCCFDMLNHRHTALLRRHSNCFCSSGGNWLMARVLGLVSTWCARFVGFVIHKQKNRLFCSEQPSGTEESASGKWDLANKLRVLRSTCSVLT